MEKSCNSKELAAMGTSPIPDESYSVICKALFRTKYKEKILDKISPVVLSLLSLCFYRCVHVVVFMLLISC
jgi:hypothetical protein